MKPLRVQELPNDQWKVEGYPKPLSTRQMLAAAFQHRIGRKP